MIQRTLAILGTVASALSPAAMIDRTVAAVSPAAGLRRLAARQAYQQLHGRSLEAGKVHRLNPRRAKPEGPDLINVAELQTARQRYWQAYYDDPTMRKIARTVVAQVVGCGLVPESLAVGRDRKPLDDFREAAQELWAEFGAACDWLGKPGQGGQDVAGMERQGVNELLGCGEYYIRFRYLTKDEQAAREIPIPLLLELIEAERLLESDSIVKPTIKPTTGNRVFRGIEYDAPGRRVAYHFLKYNPNDARASIAGKVFETERVPVDEVLHVFIPDRPRQSRGITWASPGLRQLSGTSDYQENELVASAVSSCTSIVTKLEGGSTLPRLNAPAGERTADDDGNPLRRWQPGGVVQLLPNESFEGFTPNRPNASAEAFILHMIRVGALSFPGVKGSTIHGDYRGSSYSSEKSADNDCWRETEVVQESIVSACWRPVWAKMIEVGLMSGWFDKRLDRRSFSMLQYRESRARFDAVEFAGPVAKSVNPLQDENAIAQGIKNGTTSAIDAAASQGHKARDLLRKQAALMDYAKSLKLPEGVIAQLLGLTTSPAMPDIGPDPNAAADGSVQDPNAAADGAGKGGGKSSSGGSKPA